MTKRKTLHLCIAFVLLLAGFGQTTYACLDMEMPPQPVCCCDDTGAPRADGNTACGAADSGCCSTAFETTGENGATVHGGAMPKPVKAFFDQQPDDTPWYIALVEPQRPQPALGPPHSGNVPTAVPSSGTRTYLHTLRLRI